MANLDSVNQLYKLPKNENEKIVILSRILDIPLHLSKNFESHAVEAMCATILYRHLDRLDRLTAMKIIRSTGNPILSERLAQKAVDTLINPQWHIWSLTNDELKSDIAFHKKFDQIANMLGYSVSALGAKDLAKSVLNQKRLGKKGWTTLVIWATVHFNNKELRKGENEMANRTSINQGSEFH